VEFPPLTKPFVKSSSRDHATSSLWCAREERQTSVVNSPPLTRILYGGHSLVFGAYVLDNLKQKIALQSYEVGGGRLI
jgi:hypothetical protein